MKVNGGKKSTRISLHISPLFFNTVSKPVQALVVTYYEILQALATEGDVLLPKPILGPHPTHSTAPTQPPWTFTCLANWKSFSRVGDFHLMTQLKPKSGNVFGSRTSPSVARVWKISFVTTCA
jgi:hypothetical protein